VFQKLRTLKSVPLQIECLIIGRDASVTNAHVPNPKKQQSFIAVQVVINTLSDPGEPVAGAHCQFCPARLICPAARNEAENAALAKVNQLPLGKGAAKLLTQIKRARSLFNEVD
jgi:hypothetical protein